MRMRMRMRGKERYARGANKATVHPPTPPPHAAFILLSSSVAVMTTRKGTLLSLSLSSIEFGFLFSIEFIIVLVI